MSEELVTCLRIAARELSGRLEENNAISAPATGIQIAAMVLAVAALRWHRVQDAIDWAEHAECITIASGWTTCTATDRAPEFTFDRGELRQEVELVLARSATLQFRA